MFIVCFIFESFLFSCFINIFRSCFCLTQTIFDQMQYRAAIIFTFHFSTQSNF